jgi:hypothetical protein
MFPRNWFAASRRGTRRPGSSARAWCLIGRPPQLTALFGVVSSPCTFLANRPVGDFGEIDRKRSAQLANFGLPLAEPMKEPRRHRPGLNTDAYVVARVPAHGPLDPLGRGGAYPAPDPSTFSINNADCRGLLGHVQADLMGHQIASDARFERPQAPGSQHHRLWRRHRDYPMSTHVTPDNAELRVSRGTRRPGYLAVRACTVAPSPEGALRPAPLEAVPGSNMMLVGGANVS